MGKVLVNDSSLLAVAEAIRVKTGSDDKFKPCEMGEAVLSIPVGEGKVEQQKSVTITANGTTNVTPDSGKTLSKVTVNVDVPSTGGGVDTSDATVTASDLAKDVIAYGQGGTRIVGSVETKPSYAYFIAKKVTDYASSDYFDFEHTLTKDVLCKTGCTVAFGMKKENFGTASASDVAKGKTFTSKDGYLVEGTNEGGQGGSVVTMSDDGNGNVTLNGVTMVVEEGNATLV